MNLPATDCAAPELQHQECISSAAVGILNATCGVTLQPLNDDKDLCSDGVVIAVISLVGHVEWSMFIGLPRQTAPALVAKFAGFAVPFESADMGDAVGELANMLAGDVKARLDAKGVKTDISLPTVIRAENIHVLIQRASATFKQFYNSDLGPLWIGVTAGRPGGLVA